MWSPEFNNAAIVEYTAAIPEARQNQQLPLPSYILFHKLISVRVCYKYFYLLSSANDARMSSASSNTKLEVKYNGA
jgi:hypothetical protein